MKRPPPRCAACGRFRRPSIDDHCDGCRVRGFVAMHLFDPSMY